MDIEEILVNPMFRSFVARRTLMDDRYASAVLAKHPGVIQEMVRKFTGLSELVVKWANTQVSFDAVGVHGVRLDVFAVDGNGNWHNIELQNAIKGAHPKRARLNSSSLVVHSLRPGEDYRKIPTIYVIFVVRDDLFGRGKQLYHFVTQECDGDFALYDGNHIIYAVLDNADDSEVGKLLHDMTQADPEKMKNPVIKGMTDYAKKTREGQESIMVPLYDEYKTEFEEARAEGRAQGLKEGRTQGLMEGRTQGRMEGKAEGKAEGRAEGRAEGLLEGKAQGRKEILDLLLEIDKLTKEECAQLAAS